MGREEKSVGSCSKLKTEPARSSVELPSGGQSTSFHSGCRAASPLILAMTGNVDGGVAEARTTISLYGDVTHSQEYIVKILQLYR
jgi:hypothetical protein